MNKDRLNHVAALLVTLGIGAITEYTNVKHAWWGAVVIGILTNWRLALTGKQAVAGPAGPSVPPAALVLLLAFLAVPACAGKAPATGPALPPVIADTAACAEKAVHDEALNLLPTVASDLLGGDYASVLSDLGKALKSGGVAVADAAIWCAVAEVAKQSYADAKRTGDQIESLKVEHANAWLGARAAP